MARGKSLLGTPKHARLQRIPPLYAPPSKPQLAAVDVNAAHTALQTSILFGGRTTTTDVHGTVTHHDARSWGARVARRLNESGCVLGNRLVQLAAGFKIGVGS